MSHIIQKVTFLYTSSSLDKPVKGVIMMTGSKIRVSLSSAGQYIPAFNKKDARSLAEKIIQSGFKHKSVISIKELDKGLVSLLKRELDVVKDSYMQEVSKFCENNFVAAERDLAASLEDWYQRFGIAYFYPQEPDGRIPLPIPVSEAYMNGSYRLMMHKKDELLRIKQKGKKLFETKYLMRAEVLFSDVLPKIANRLIRKGFVNGRGLKMETRENNGNFEMTVKNEKLIVRVMIHFDLVTGQCPKIKFVVR